MTTLVDLDIRVCFEIYPCTGVFVQNIVRQFESVEKRLVDLVTKCGMTFEAGSPNGSVGLVPTDNVINARYCNTCPIM